MEINKGILFIIPARRGSKGLKNKNLKHLNGYPLIHFTLDFAKKISGKNDIICFSSDCNEMIKYAKSLNLNVPFKRPKNLSGDNVQIKDVIKHALTYFKKKGDLFKIVCLLQPTTPFRKVEDFNNMIKLINENTDQVISVKKSKNNPDYNLFQIDKNSYKIESVRSKNSNRQLSSNYFSNNGSIYIYKADIFFSNRELKKTRVYIMENEKLSIDIDTKFDFEIAKLFLDETS